MADQETIFCEQCGAVVHAADRFIDAHYCAACELFLCVGCWSEAGPRCATCETIPLTSLRVGERISWARNLRGRLEAFRPWRAPAAGRQSSQAGLEDLDARLTAIRVESTAALGTALVAGSRSAEARRLRDDIEFERLRAITALAGVGARRGASVDARVPQAILSRLRSISRTWQPLRSAAPPILGIAGAFATLAAVLVVAAVLFGGRDPVPTGGIARNSTPTPEGAVAGNRTATPTLAPSAQPDEGNSGSPLTFDELIMGRELPRAIHRLVQSGRAEVAAIPNAVDRSLRLLPSDGTPGMLCQRVPDSGSRTVFAEVLTPVPNGQRLVLRPAPPVDQPDAGIEVEEGGRLVLVPEGTMLGSIAPDEWLVVEMQLDPSAGTLHINTESASGSGRASVQIALPGGVGDLAQPEFCISSPAVDGGEVYVNNLRID